MQVITAKSDIGQAPPAATGARAPDHDHWTWLAKDAAFPTGWQGKAIVDLGCGSGYLCQQWVSGGARHVVGVDLLSPDVRPEGWHFQTLNLDASNWPAQLARSPSTGGAQPQQFDLVCAFDLLEHLDSPVQFLSQCRSLLSPGGQLVLSTPNTTSWERILRPERWSGATDPQHKILFNRYSLDFLLRRVGFQPKVLRAPVRRLEAMGIPCPQVGAQIFCVARVAG